MFSKGLAYEKMAQRHLMKQGLIPIEQNFHSRYGEIDLIMREQNTIVFIEVRYRKNLKFGNPAETVTRNKQMKIITTARHFLSERKLWDRECRFDIIAINQVSNSTHKKLNWLKAAFTTDQ